MVTFDIYVFFFITRQKISVVTRIGPTGSRHAHILMF